MSADTNTPESVSEETLSKFFVSRPKKQLYSDDTLIWDIVKLEAGKQSYAGYSPSITMFCEMCRPNWLSYFKEPPTIGAVKAALDFDFLEGGIEPFTLARFRNEYGYTCSA